MGNPAKTNPEPDTPGIAVSLTSQNNSVEPEPMDSEPTVPAWEDESLSELERWNAGGAAVDAGLLEFEDLIEVAKGFSEETKELIRLGSIKRTCESGWN